MIQETLQRRGDARVIGIHRKEQFPSCLLHRAIEGDVLTLIWLPFVSHREISSPLPSFNQRVGTVIRAVVYDQLFEVAKGLLFETVIDSLECVCAVEGRREHRECVGVRRHAYLAIIGDSIERISFGNHVPWSVHKRPVLFSRHHWFSTWRKSGVGVDSSSVYAHGESTLPKQADVLLI